MYCWTFHFTEMAILMACLHAYPYGNIIMFWFSYHFYLFLRPHVFFLMNLFLVVLVLCCCARTFSSCEWGLLLVWVHTLLIAARRSLLILWTRCTGSAVVACGLSCSMACGILLDQRSNPCPLYWQVDSYPLHHQGSPHIIFKKQTRKAVIFTSWKEWSELGEDSFCRKINVRGGNKHLLSTVMGLLWWLRW